MGMKAVLVLIFIIPLYSLAGEREEAMKGVQKAILSYPVVKKYKRTLEKKALKYVPVEKETAGVIGGVALSAAQGYVDTKVIKRMNVKVIGGDMRPNVRYNFKNGQLDSTVNINWSF